MKRILSVATLMLITFGIPFTYAQAEPLINIISPTDDDRIEVGQPIVLNFEIGNFTFTNPGSSNPAPFAGYAVVWTDISDRKQTEENGRLLVSDGFVNLGQFSPGKHTITIGLFRPDGSRMDPRTSRSTTFTVSVFQKGGISGFYPAIFILVGMALAMLLAVLIAAFIYRNSLKKHKLTNKIKEIYEKLRRRD